MGSSLDSGFQSGYLGIVAIVILAAIICAVMVTGSWLFGPKKHTPYKNSTYECGVAPVGNVRDRFPVKFYLVAIVFILFDIEVAFLWSWLTVFKDADLQFKQFSFLEFISYMASWIVGYLYVIRVGAIDWEEESELDVRDSSPRNESISVQREFVA